MLSFNRNVALLVMVSRNCVTFMVPNNKLVVVDCNEVTIVVGISLTPCAVCNKRLYKMNTENGYVFVFTLVDASRDTVIKVDDCEFVMSVRFAWSAMFIAGFAKTRFQFSQMIFGHKNGLLSKYTDDIFTVSSDVAE